MKDRIDKIRKWEFEFRIFISLSIVAVVCWVSYSMFDGTTTNLIRIGKTFGFGSRATLTIGYLGIGILMGIACLLRMWAGSLLSSPRVMAFRVQSDAFITEGPYQFVRNPIYLADLIAMGGFAICLPPIGVFLPVFFYMHYHQLIKYEESSLVENFRGTYDEYFKKIPRLFPDFTSFTNLYKVRKEFQINKDGFRNNAIYFLFIFGFILAGFTHQFLHAVIIGLPAVIDWAIVHTKKGIARKTDEPGGETGKADPTGNKVFEDILYAQCWEDPQIDRAALKIGTDDIVFSVTSGGDNVLTFLLDNPRKVVAVDLNPHQNYILDLKMAAFTNLSYEELIEFVGVRRSNRRPELYRRVRASLCAESREYWDGQAKKILGGIIHCGRFEAYMRLLRNVLRLLLGSSLIKKLFEMDDPNARLELFHKRWDTIRWKLFTRIMLSRNIMTHLFDKAFFTYLEGDFSIGKHFASKLEQAFTRLPMKLSYFLSYILLGNYYSEDHLPPYLQKENFEIIRDRVNRIVWITDSCQHFFFTLPENTISKFNFTNIFEWMSPEACTELLKETIRVATHNAILTYRNLLVFRERSPLLANKIRSLKKLARSLHQRDLSVIYKNYVVEKIQKKGMVCHTQFERRATVVP